MEGAWQEGDSFRRRRAASEGCGLEKRKGPCELIGQVAVLRDIWADAVRKTGETRTEAKLMSETRAGKTMVLTKELDSMASCAPSPVRHWENMDDKQRLNIFYE